MQDFLNSSFAAEAAVHKFVELSSSLPLDAISEPSENAEARAESKRLNLEILSGRRGKQAVRECFALLASYTGGHWTDLQMPRAGKLDLANGIMQLIADAYRRLVFAYELQPKFQVFAAGESLEYNEARITRVCQPILDKQRHCEGCVCKFSAIWSTSTDKQVDSLQSSVGA